MRTRHLQEAHYSSCGLHHESVIITIILLTITITNAIIIIMVLLHQIIRSLQQNAKSFSYIQFTVLRS